MLQWNHHVHPLARSLAWDLLPFASLSRPSFRSPAASTSPFSDLFLSPSLNPQRQA